MEMSAIAPLNNVTQDMLDSLNVEQAKEDNKANLDKIGGVEALAKLLNVDIKTGVKHSQVLGLRAKYGNNQFPESPMATFLDMLLDALNDSTLMILIAAATVSLIIGSIEEPAHGWIEGVAIFVAVTLVAFISAGNDYSKEVQFRKLEATSAEDERTSVFREGVIERINPMDIVVGDILVLQAGDAIAADCIICDDSAVTSSEAALTGEPEDMKKSKNRDPFLLSSCLITAADETRALVVGIGTHSQWGKIKASLVMESVNTPLQDKLQVMTEKIGYVGMIAAIATFIALVVNIWVIDHGEQVVQGIIEAFIQAVVIVVVAIPEGLPLAVTIALSYSTSKMYQDQCFIRVLAACETMGNATNICSDKTGTLTENRMTVVAGWYADAKFTQDTFANATFSSAVTAVIAEQACISRTAYLVYNDAEGRALPTPNIIGNKTEGALLMLAKKWGYDDEKTRSENFDEKKDKVFAFNSSKKRSTTIIHKKDGSVTVYCKGASEWVIQDCTHYLSPEGKPIPFTAEKRKDLDAFILSMAELALRTLTLTHKYYPAGASLPSDYMENPPDNADLVLDCIVGIIDPLRGDVKEAVRIAQGAGVTVRMVTGDNLATAKAIARQCGIYRDGNGIGVEGPDLRKMTPAELDSILPTLQVVGRSSPDDKYLLVTRLNGHGVPANQAEWEAKHKDKTGVTWDTHKDKLLPGYREEWESTRPGGGQVVGVTGDGTNDAPALKAADVGLAMGITGTKVAQSASDIVILDDRFGSIVRAIMWGRSIYDNIRKFLQFQLTVNVVALLLVFIGACAGFGEPLNAVQMLWVNLVMDTLGALALATEPPSMELLKRKPYKRQTALISHPMWRNILVGSFYQIIMLLVLLFKGAEWFGVYPGEEGCRRFKVSNSDQRWSALTHSKIPGSDPVGPDDITCIDFASTSFACDAKDSDCLHHQFPVPSDSNVKFKFEELDGFESKCLTCKLLDRKHHTLVFNAFIFCQFFNLFNSRILFNDRLNPFYNITTSPTFVIVGFFIFAFQVLLINVSGEFMKVEPLDMNQWLITIGLGIVTVPLSMCARMVPIVESPDDFFDNSESEKAVTVPDSFSSPGNAKVSPV